MRVTFASYDDDPPLGGQGVVLHGMREALRARGIAVETVSGRGQNAVAYPRLTGRAPLDFSLQLTRHPRLLEAAHPDVVHAHGGPGGVLLLRRLSVPLVYTAHHTYRQAYSRTQPRRALGPLEARAYRHAAMVLPVSRSTADALRAMGIPASRIEVVPPGIDVDEEAATHEAGRMLFVGRLEPEKGVLDALTVMERVVSANAGAHGVLIGTGSQAAAVRERVRGQPRIEYLGRVDGVTLQAEYRRASVLLMPSRYEGLGMVALEAQAAGTPVAGYDVEGLRDAAPEGGVLVRFGDLAALQRAVSELLGDAARSAELGRRGRDRVRREHDWRAIAARLEEVYSRIT